MITHCLDPAGHVKAALVPVLRAAGLPIQGEITQVDKDGAPDALAPRQHFVLYVPETQSLTPQEFARLSSMSLEERQVRDEEGTLLYTREPVAQAPPTGSPEGTESTYVQNNAMGPTMRSRGERGMVTAKLQHLGTTRKIYKKLKKQAAMDGNMALSKMYDCRQLAIKVRCGAGWLTLLAGRLSCCGWGSARALVGSP
jgi:hypothetical protein